ncbi:hypothetical protein EDB89DRAFT_2205368 [Lactarius sanguifluus]|nr:hypothetical protein EDB89DRAFT_2205368 [Lactarius sanguifluus]
MAFDQDPNGGYKAIVRMSEEQPRWLQRNVDVLVQLLQSDEPEEVAVIKMVLIQHLELDSKVTLSILCDRIVPLDDPMEDEDKTIREHPEALAVAFLTQDTRKPLLAQLHGQRCGAAEQEVSKSSAAKIIEDVLVFLPSFNDRWPIWRENGGPPRLVLLLLVHATSALREDLAPGQNAVNLEQSRGYLELSDLLSHTKGATDLA